MSVLLIVHLVIVGLWVGCILTEAIFEHTTGRAPGMAQAIADLHVRVDLFVEAPAFILTGLSGLGLALQTAQTPWTLAKEGFGALAIVTNIVCVWIVLARARALRAGHVAYARRLDDWQHKSGGALAFLLMATFVLAGLRL